MFDRYFFHVAHRLIFSAPTVSPHVSVLSPSQRREDPSESKEERCFLFLSNYTGLLDGATLSPAAVDESRSDRCFLFLSNYTWSSS
jgi:hypothetical protein